MTYEQLPDERKEWVDLTPLERFRRSEEIFAQYLAMGGSLDPDPDPTSPFYSKETLRQTASIADGRLPMSGRAYVFCATAHVSKT